MTEQTRRSWFPEEEPPSAIDRMEDGVWLMLQGKYAVP